MKYQILLIIFFISFTLANNFFLEKLDTNYTLNILPNSSLNIMISPDIIGKKENNIVICPNLAFNVFYINVSEYNTIKFIVECENGIKKIYTDYYSINVYSNLSSDILKCTSRAVLLPGNRIMDILLVNIIYYMCLFVLTIFFYFLYIILKELINTKRKIKNETKYKNY